MNTRGHNERSFRLDTLAGDARSGLERVQRGEADAIEGWLAYGAALNEGRSLFPGDREFGQWVEANVLSQLATAEVTRDERAAAMWAAANSDQFEEARAAGKARTVRGIHAKWKEIEAERERERLAEEQRQKAAADKAEAAQCAEQAKAEAAAKAEQEVEAKKAVEQADEEGRAEAEQKAAAAAEERQAAEQAAEEAAAAASHPEEADEPEAAPDPHAKLRAEFRKLSDEGKEEDWIGLRLENGDLRKRVASQRSEIADLKAQIKELTSDEDAGRKIGNLQRRLRQSEGRMKEHQSSAARLQRQVNAQRAEIEKLQKRLENQEIQLS